MDARRTEYKSVQVKATGEFVKIIYRDWSNMTFRVEFTDGRKEDIKERDMTHYIY